MSTSTLPLGGNSETWQDGKRWLWLLSPVIPLLVVLFMLGGHFADAGWAFWAPALVIYLIVPMLDWIIGTDTTNPPESAVAGLDQDRYYRAIVYAYLPSQYFATIFGAWLAVNGDLATWELAGLIIGVGIVNGIGINTAHELGHKTNGLERWLAKLTLAPVAYGHFFVEHNKGHHKNVATPEDPASSKMGESFWVFLPRTVIGSVRSAWRIEKDRLARTGDGVWTTKNENLQAWSLTVLLFAGLTAWLGPWALVFLVAQAIYGAGLLEVINYIEHYGLLRLKIQGDRYERCQPKHSWNSNHIVTNLVLYQLQRHSDHHANPTRRFQALRHFDDSPQLPSGYASMLLLAYFPPLWFRWMDPLVVKHHRGDLTRANLYAPKRDQLLARWQGTSFEGAPSTVARPAAAEATATTAATFTPAKPQALVLGYQCNNCGYIYKEAEGCPREGYAAGTRWSELPDSWPCPDCAVRDKLDFVPLIA